MIQISSVSIQNFLSFQKPILVKDIYPVSVLVGPNNAGKSNSIRALSFYRELLFDSKEHHSKFDSIKNKYHQLTSNQPCTISIKYKFEDENFSHYPLEIDHLIVYTAEGMFDKERFFLRKNGKVILVIKKEGTKFYEQHKELVNEFLFDERSNISTTASEGMLTQITSIKYMPFLWSDKEDNPGIRIYNEIKKYIESWIFISADRLIDISKREKNLRDQLSSNRKVSNKLVEEMCRFSGVYDINVEEKDGKSTSYISDSKDISVTLANLGSGFQQIFAMYPQFFEGYADGTVFFIEEPEAHLHPLLQRKLLQVFIKRSKTNQFFITTHSAIFSRYQENIIKPHLVEKVDFNTIIKELGRDEMNEIKEVLGYVNTDLFGYNAVFFVEGHSEYKTLPLLASNLGIDIVNDGIRLVNSEGYGNMIQIKNIIELLKDTTTEVYALFDNHAANQGELQDIKHCLNQNNYIELPNNFEGSFNREILVKALSTILDSEGHSLNNSEITTIEQDLKSQPLDAFEVLSKAYKKKTQIRAKLSKVCLGESIASELKENHQFLGKSKPEELLKRIHDKVEEKMNLE